MTEIELKFLLTDDQAARLDARIADLPGLRASPVVQTLHSAYHDTDGGALRAAGIALRLRHDGAGWVQTVKSRASNHCAMQSVTESETGRPDGTLDPAAIPDDGLRAEVLALTEGAPLAPRVETRIRRLAAMVDMPGGGSAEVALDRGTLRAGDREAALTELEIEWKSGPVTVIYELARQLLPEGGLRLSRRSKAARAQALADGGLAIDPPALRKADAVALSADQTVEAAARDVLRECFDQISANAELVLAEDAAEGPHQLRIGLRRLRTAFDLFATVLDSPTGRRLKDEARWFATETGRLRDLDVAVADLLTPEAEAHPTEPGFARLAAHLTARADDQRRILRADLAGPRAQAFLLDLAQFTESRGWLDPWDITQSARLARPLGDLAAETLEAPFARAARRARGIDTLAVEARHDLRKALKALRYAVEFFAPVLPGPETDSFLKRLRRLQDLFGALNDLAMAQDLLTGPQAPGADDPAAQRAVGWILGVRSMRADADWSGARKLWHALRDAPRPWQTAG